MSRYKWDNIKTVECVEIFVTLRSVNGQIQIVPLAKDWLNPRTVLVQIVTSDFYCGTHAAEKLLSKVCLVDITKHRDTW